MRITEEQARNALSSIAYAHVMLTTYAGRATEIASKWWEAKQQREGLTSSAFTNSGSLSTSSTMVTTTTTTFGAQHEGPGLTEYRAYVELSLIKARTVSDVVARTSSSKPDDILACDLVADPGFKLPGLDASLRKRINKSAVHLVIYSDPKGGQWEISKMADWASTTMKRFQEKLERTQPQRARWFAAELARYRAEVDQLG